MGHGEQGIERLEMDRVKLYVATDLTSRKRRGTQGRIMAGFDVLKISSAFADHDEIAVERDLNSSNRVKRAVRALVTKSRPPEPK